MLRWKLFDTENNAFLGEYQNLRDAFSEGNLFHIKTGKHYFIEDSMLDEDLCWNDVEGDEA